MRVISWEVMLEQPTLILTEAVRQDGWMLSRGINRPRTVWVARLQGPSRVGNRKAVHRSLGSQNKVVWKLSQAGLR